MAMPRAKTDGAVCSGESTWWLGAAIHRSANEKIVSPNRIKNDIGFFGIENDLLAQVSRLAGSKLGTSQRWGWSGFHPHDEIQIPAEASLESFRFYRSAKLALGNSDALQSQFRIVCFITIIRASMSSFSKGRNWRHLKNDVGLKCDLTKLTINDFVANSNNRWSTSKWKNESQNRIAQFR